MIKKSDTEKLICKTFLDMVREIPFDKIKVTELIRRAGISRSAFYSYFDSVYAVMDKIENDFLEGLTMGPEEATRVKMKYLEQNREVVEVLVSPNGDPSFYTRLLNRTRKLIEKRYSGPNGKTDLQLRLFAEYLSGGIWSVVRWWVFHPSQATMEEVFEQLQALVGQTEFNF